MFGMAPTSGDETRHLQRLATLVQQQRVRLGFSKEGAAGECGMSRATYDKIEGTRAAPPRRVKPDAYAKVDEAFKMRPRSCLDVADGRVDSITLQDGTELIENAKILDYVNQEQLEDELDRAFDKSAALHASDFTLSKSKAMKEDMMAFLRKRGVLRSE